MRNLGRLVLFLLAAFVTDATPAVAATLPPGFAETQIASGLPNPTAMAFAPDGRLFVCLQGGAVRVIKNGALLPAPFVSLSVNSNGERGLLGIAFDPAFLTNPFVYLYYTTSTAPIHNRISRFTANGDVAAPGSETVLFELDNLTAATNHNGGAIHFAADGKLYVGVGENATPSNAQSLSNVLGKILRLNADGSIPSDNPFYNQTTGNARAIWALGLRNPFTFAFDPLSGRMFINDVGQNTFEEINDGIEGANYGWPDSEGPTSNPNHTGPLYHYSHGAGPFTGCSITGGTFYNPPVAQFPAQYAGLYFFGDFCSGWINTYNPVTEAVATFASGVSLGVDLQVGPEGSLYYLARGSGGALYRVSHTGSPTPHTLTLYLHGDDLPGTAGDFTMNQTPPPAKPLILNLSDSPSWFSDPALTGTFQSASTFQLVLPCTLAMSLSKTVRLAATALDGREEQSLGQVTRGPALCLGQEIFTIPVTTPLTLTGRRLKLTITSSVDLGLNLQMGAHTFLRATSFVGTP